MTTPNTTEKSLSEIETKEALAEMQRLAANQGVRPFEADKWLSDNTIDVNPDATRIEVDAFLEMLREWRDAPSQRSMD